MATTVGGGFVYTSIVGPQGLDSVSGSGPPSPVLLPDLVAGWSLTSGPQQTLSSAGVISGGPYDLGNQGTVTFGANGASFNGVDQSLFHAISGLRIGVDLLFLEAEINETGFGDFIFVYLLANTSDTATDPFQLNDDNSDIVTVVVNGNLGNPSFSPFTENSVHHVFLWFDNISGGNFTIHLQVDNGTELTAVSPVPLAGDWFCIGGAFYTGGITDVVSKSNIRRVRAWSSITAPVAARDWLYNSGAGRTDAEIAAYTG